MDIDDDKQHEHLMDASGDANQSSNCCGAAVYVLGDAAICKDCKEYCDIVTDEE